MVIGRPKADIRLAGGQISCSRLATLLGYLNQMLDPTEVWGQLYALPATRPPIFNLKHKAPHPHCSKSLTLYAFDADSIHL